MEKINIAEILKDCPKGMELYSPIFGTVYFEGIRDTGRAILIDVTTSCNTSVQFYSDGKFNTYYSESEVTLFPSKSQRDWSKFQRPFKDGDILYIKAAFDWICIYKEIEYTENVYNYVAVLMQSNATNLFRDECCLCCRENISEIRLATEEEKQKLFDAIKANGYRWNDETKTLGRLIVPKFKVGDVIQYIDSYKVKITEVNIEDECYGYESVISKRIDCIGFNEQDNWKLVPNKFDINTLVPFKSEVLVRNSDSGFWKPAFWGTYEAEKSNEHQYRNYLTTEGFVRHCIPYNDETKHLIGKTSDCPENYKTW